MGFIEGIKLSDRLRDSGPLNLEQACRLFIRLADGLSAAHAIGLVHRDLSPDNVMLRNDRIEKAVLIDFGIAKSSHITDVTLGGEFAGKLKYVSPEQLGAYGGQADQRSDIYSMGLLMIIVCTGHAAPMGTTIVEAVRQREGIPDLSAVPQELHGLLTQMLQPDPQYRTPDMQTVKSALEAIMSGAGFEPTTGSLAANPGMAGGVTGRPHTMPLMPGPSASVQGLQSSPMSANTTTTGISLTHSPYSSQPAAAPASPPPAPEKSGGRTGLIIASAVVALLGAGGAYFLTQDGGLPFGGGTGEEEAVQADPKTPTEFLARAIPEGCLYATRRGAGASSGMIEAFHPADVSIGNLIADYTALFGAAPALVEREVAPGQCAALELARNYQDGTGTPIEFGLDTPSLTGREPFKGKIGGLADRRLSLFLITPNGQTYSANAQFVRVDSENATVGGGLSRFPNGIYVMVAVASENDLANARNFDPGSSAYDLFRKLQDELEKQDNVSVNIATIEKK